MVSAPLATGGSPGWEPNPAIKTLVFVDVDGVLNLALRDPEDPAPVGFSRENISVALQVCKTRKRKLRSHAMFERILAFCKRRLPEKQGGSTSATTYATLAHSEAAAFHDTLVQRLAQILLAATAAAAGAQQPVAVLSSSWRMPAHVAHVRRLEAAVAKHLGRPFAFDARTSLQQEHDAADRIRHIGDFLASHPSPGVDAASKSELRVLVLDDFMINPLESWLLDGVQLDSAKDVEQYLHERAPAGVDVSVRVVHTYDEWTTPAGLHVQVGTGLTIDKLRRAEAFLRGEACEADASGDDPPPVPEPITPPARGGGRQLARRGSSLPRAPPASAAAAWGRAALGSGGESLLLEEPTLKKLPRSNSESTSESSTTCETKC